MSIKFNFRNPFLLIAACITLLLFQSCISSYKHIPYQQNDDSEQIDEEYLNIFTPSKTGSPRNVFIFIHGGGWDSGSPSLYNFLGRKMARKGIVAVIISYPLSPDAQYNEMAAACAKAVTWVKDHISKYGGGSAKIFISGHSSGGHLATLISLNDAYFQALNVANPIKGAILIDAAGLDMYSFLKKNDFEEDNSYIKTFTTDPENWKDASPLYYVDKTMPPMLIYRGGLTYPSIKTSTETFVDSVKTYKPETTYRILDELDHIAMIGQFLFSSNLLYDEIIRFMNHH